MTPYTAPDYDLELKQINNALQKLDKGVDAASLYFQSNRGLYLGIRNPSEKDTKVFYHALSGHPDIIMEKLKGILWILNVLTGGVRWGDAALSWKGFSGFSKEREEK